METRRGPRPLAPGTRGKAPGAEAAACREVAGMRASAHFPPASERVLLGSAGRPYSPSIAELCRDGAPPSCRGPYGEHGGGSAASPRCSRASLSRLKGPSPPVALTVGRRLLPIPLDQSPPARERVAPKLVPIRRARQPPPRRSEDASCCRSSVAAAFPRGAIGAPSRRPVRAGM